MGHVRETWVFPGNGEAPYIKGTRPDRLPPPQSGVIFMPDLPDFVSPIDKKSYSGRAGMREHNKRHDVVPNAELQGLPTLTMQSNLMSASQKRSSEEHRKRTIINEVNRHYR